MIDAEGGEIKGSFFGEAADKWFSHIDEGKAYVISKGDIKQANKKFNPNAQYEIMFNKQSQFQECEVGDIPKQFYNFKPISAIAGEDKDAVVDVGCVGDTDTVVEGRGFSEKSVN